MRIGIGGGSVTSEVYAAPTRHVLAHVGPGLDAAVRAQQSAPPDGIAVEDVNLELTPPAPGGREPAWAKLSLHPVTAQRVASGGGPPDEHRHVTTVFVSLPPELADLGSFLATATDLIDEFGGDVLQCSGGDKGVVLFAVFGTPIAHSDDAARAVHAIEQLRSLTGVDFAAGITSGLTFTAAFGGRSRAFISALGNPTNLAARLMAAAPNGATLVDERAASALRGRAILGDARSMSLKGVAAPVAVAEVRRLVAAGRQFDSGGATPMVGRAVELAAAERLLDDLGDVLRIVGDPGSGKSRLADEIARRARIRGLLVYEGAFDAFGLGRPLAPFSDLLRLVLGPYDELGSAVGRVLPGQEPLAPLLGSLLDHPLGHTALIDGLDDDERAELREKLVVDLLCATDVPTLAVLEDLHWADELSLRMVAALESRLPGSRLALVTTSRPGSADTVRPLPELPKTDIAAIVRDTWGRLGGGELPGTYVDTLADRAAGSPLFAETVTELARHAARPGEPLPALPLPDQLLPFLTAQLDALGDAVQETALRAAVLGRSATGAELAEVFGGDPVAIESHLSLLAEAAIARRTGARTWLRHATVAEALLARAAHGTRAPLHERVCRHLIAHDAPVREIARQLEHCQPPDLELRFFRDARTEAWAAWALREARHWAELAIVRGDSADAADQLALAELEQQLGHHERALEQLARISDTPEVTAGIARLRGRIAYENGRPQDAVDELAPAEAAGTVDATVSWPLTMALCDLGRFEEARDRATKQLAAAGPDEPRLRLDALANLGAVVLREGDLALVGRRARAGTHSRAEPWGRDAARARHGRPRRHAVHGRPNRGGREPARRGVGPRSRARRASRCGDDAWKPLPHPAGRRRSGRCPSGRRSQSAEAALAIGDVAIALDFAQLLAVVAELDGEREAGDDVVASTRRPRGATRPSGGRCQLLATPGRSPRRGR